MTEIGRLLQTLRRAGGLTREQAASAADCLPARIRDLESGRASLEYLEAMRLTKAYLLCPTCFRRLFDCALDREATSAQSAYTASAGGQAEPATVPSDRPSVDRLDELRLPAV